MKMKYYLRGIGVGIIVTTLILTVAFALNDKTTTPSTETQSSYDYLENLKTSQAAGEKDSSSSNDKESDKESQSDKESESQSEKESEAQGESQMSQDNTQESSSSDGVKIVYEVDLSRVETSEQAARIIAGIGIVKDWEDFNNYLISNGFGGGIGCRIYRIEHGSSYEEIAKIITGNN